jgi:hypothetical protein
MRLVALGFLASALFASLSTMSSSSLSERNLPRGKGKKRWSVKYKRSIDCRNPRGFSQKNYCDRMARGGRYLRETM